MVAARKQQHRTETVSDPLMGGRWGGGVSESPLFAAGSADIDPPGDAARHHPARGGAGGEGVSPDGALRPADGGGWGEAANETHEARALEWMAANPEAMQCFTRLALQMAGRDVKFGMKHLGEIVRWRMKLQRRVPVVGEPGTREFKINNNHLAYIGRELIRRHAHLEAFIETRRAGEEDGLTTETQRAQRGRRGDFL